ncbi:MAG: hypothetical protein EAX87_03545 [Candidatus Thorarchaeota archaeon]|nr:hypothetical protein [Candidatus Thorarchaeota archaeon]
MKHVNMKTVLGITISMIFLLGAIAAPVSALQTNIKIKTYNQGYASGANNHTYMYVEPNPLDFQSRSTMNVNEDLDYWIYRYDTTGWTRQTSSFAEDMNVPYDWTSFSTWNTGPFANPAYLPEFYDWTASDGSDFVVNTTIETRTFGLTFGQHTPVSVDRGYTYYGTLGISGQEFVHLTIASRQDGVSWSVAIVDPQGRYMNGDSGSEGDIITIPFKPSISGTYYIFLQATPTSGTFALFDLFPVAVSPQLIPAGGVITDELNTGEIVVEDTGSWVYKEMAPTVRTYKVNSRNDVASLAYTFNYPNGILPTTQPVAIEFTSNEFNYGHNGGTRYDEGSGFPSNGQYFFRGGPYYVTVYGGDGTQYTLYHQSSSQGALPLNQKMHLENYIGSTAAQSYTLDIDQPSILRVNSTATAGELSIALTGSSEDGYRSVRSPNHPATIQAANEYYLPVGKYHVELYVSNNVNEWVRFNVGSIVDETTTDIVNVGGFFVDAHLFQMYNMTLYLNNQDNVTVNFEYSIYDASGAVRVSGSTTVANRWDGSQIQAHPTIPNNRTINYGGQGYYEGFAFVGICTYQVSNNTQGATNVYMNYPVSLTIDWQNRMNDIYADIETLDVGAASAWTNFSLPLPGSGSGTYGLLLNTTPGTWYNVSVKTGDVTGFSSTLLSAYDGRAHSTPWGDLNDEYVGNIADFSFQFGAISDNSLLSMAISRNLGVDGFLWVQLTPLPTPQLSVEKITPVGPNVLAMLGGVALPAAVIVGVVVIVYIVYVKKFKQ